MDIIAKMLLSGFYICLCNDWLTMFFRGCLGVTNNYQWLFWGLLRVVGGQGETASSLAADESNSKASSTRTGRRQKSSLAASSRRAKLLSRTSTRPLNESHGTDKLAAAAHQLLLLSHLPCPWRILNLVHFFSARRPLRRPPWRQSLTSSWPSSTNCRLFSEKK